MSKKVLILGCSGQVGSRLTLLLLKYGFIILGVSGSKLCKINDRNHFCKKINSLDPRVSLNLGELKPDVMVHTAWVTTPGVFWESPINDEWDWALIQQSTFKLPPQVKLSDSIREKLGVLFQKRQKAINLVRSLDPPIAIYGGAAKG